MITWFERWNEIMLRLKLKEQPAKEAQAGSREHFQEGAVAGVRLCGTESFLLDLATRTM